MDTWNYRGIGESSKTDISDEHVWERLRLRRDALLAATDFRMVTDAPWDTTVWAAYRAQLRDLPQNTTDPRQAVWPFEP